MKEAFAAPAEPRARLLSVEGPWLPRDAVRLTQALAVGGIVLGTGWYLASEEAEWTRDAPWLALAALGLVLSGLGGVRWLLAGVQRLARERQVVKALLAQRVGPLQTTGAAEVSASSTRLVTAPDMTRYHRSDCSLVAGKSVEELTPDGLLGSGLRPCGVCQP